MPTLRKVKDWNVAVLGLAFVSASVFLALKKARSMTVLPMLPFDPSGNAAITIID
jgi:hypothetical protein